MERQIYTLGGIVGVTAYLILMHGVWREKYRFNFFTAVAWAMISLLITVINYIITIMADDSSRILQTVISAFIAIGAIGLSLVVSKHQQKIKWGRIEKSMTILFIVGLIGWGKIGYDIGFNFIANNATIFLLVVSSIPQIVDVFYRPNTKLMLPFFLMCIGTFLFCFGGNGSITEKVYIYVNLLTSLIIFVLLFIAYIKKPLTA